MNVDIDNILSSVGKPFSVVKAFTGRGAARKADGTSQLKGRRKKIIPAEDHDQDSVASLPKAVDNKLSAAMMFPIDSVPAYVVNEIPSLPAPDDVVEERKMETEKDVSVSDSESFFSSVDEDDGDSDEMVVDAAESVEDLSSIKRESFSETVRSLGEADEKGAVEEVDMDSSSEFESGSDSESHDARSLEGKGDSEGNQMVGDDKRDTN